MPIRAMTLEFIQQFYDQGRWRPDLLYQLLDRHAERTPDMLAIADQHKRLTYSEFAERLELFDELPRTAGGKLSKVTLRSAIVERAAAE